MNYAILLAGGKGERFGNASVPKQFTEMCGKPMLVYALEAAQKNKNIDFVYVVCPVSYNKTVEAWLSEYHITKVAKLVESGKNRQVSVNNGLKSIPAEKNDAVMIMTAVCPFLSQTTIDKNFETLEKFEGCITVVKATDAITFSGNGKTVNRTLQKKKLFIQQGPQTYRYGILRQGHELYEENELGQEINEDSELVLHLGVEVAMVLGDRFCVKVTYPEDLAIASALRGLFEEQESGVVV